MKQETAEAWVDKHTREIIERGVEFLQFTPEDSAVLVRIAKEAAKELAGSNINMNLALFRMDFWERYYRLLGKPQGPEPELRIFVENGESVAIVTSYEMVVLTLSQKEAKVVGA